MFSTRRLGFRWLCWLMAVLTPLGPSAVVVAQTPQAVDAYPFLVPNAVAVASLRPRQLLTCEAVEMLPVEVVVAASLKELGIDPLTVESIQYSMAMSFVGVPDYAAVVTFTDRVDFSKWSPKLTQHTVKAKRDEKAYLQSQVPSMPSIYWLGGKSILLAPESALDSLLGDEPVDPGSFAAELSKGMPDDFLLQLELTQLRPVIQAGLMQATSKIPSEMMGLLELPNLIQQMRLQVSLSGAGPVDLSFATNDAKAADRVSEILDEVIAYYQTQAKAQAEKLLASDDPVEQAMGRYVNRVSPKFGEGFSGVRTDNRFTLFNVPPNESQMSGATMIAVSGVLVALLLPAVQAAREAARRNASMNNVKQLMLALLNHEATTGSFPAHAIYDENGKPLLSWRVHALRFLDENRLYEQFHLDEPWDSEHNQKLIAFMPPVFLDPSSNLATTQGRTHYLGVKGEGHAFNGTEAGTKLAQVRDGLSNTIAIVQCSDERAVTWTKPDDLEVNPQQPLTGLTDGPHPGGFLVGFADGSVQFIANDISPDAFLGLLTIDGGERPR